MKMKNKLIAVLGVTVLAFALFQCAKAVPGAIQSETAKQQRIAAAHLEAMKKPMEGASPVAINATVWELTQERVHSPLGEK